MNTLQRITILCIYLLLRSSFAAYVSDLNPNTDCKTLLAQKASERSKNPDLVRTISMKMYCDYENIHINLESLL